MSEYKYTGIEGHVHDLGCVVRECIGCGCLVPGGPTRCKRCAAMVDKSIAQEVEDINDLLQAARSKRDAMHAKCKSLAMEKVDLLDEIEKWKEASGLQVGGDPDGVTPEMAHKYWKDIERRLSLAMTTLKALMDEKPMLGATMVGSTTLGNLFVEIGGRHGKDSSGR